MGLAAPHGKRLLQHHSRCRWRGDRGADLSADLNADLNIVNTWLARLTLGGVFLKEASGKGSPARGLADTPAQ
ncbi:MAG: hypothetical protein PHQ28_11435 [Mycobacterium sp.]|nr:hypothetical protein [Mycobacterium sp.]